MIFDEASTKIFKSARSDLSSSEKPYCFLPRVSSCSLASSDSILDCMCEYHSENAAVPQRTNLFIQSRDPSS